MKKPFYFRFSIFDFRLSILFLLLVIIGITACRSHKMTTAPVHATEGEAIFLTSCYPIESLYVSSCKFEISSDNESYTLNANIYIRPDSICYFRGKWLFFEIRGAIYRNSFVMINYAERICYKGNNDYLQKITGYPVNPESLMMLFTADRCEETYRNKFNFITTTGNNEKILMQGQNRSLLEMNINSNNHTIENIALYNSQQQQPLFSATYSGYNQYRNFVLPTILDIFTHDGKTPIRIKANIQQVQFNQPQQVNMSVSSSYKVVVLE